MTQPGPVVEPPVPETRVIVSVPGHVVWGLEAARREPGRPRVAAAQAAFDHAIRTERRREVPVVDGVVQLRGRVS